ncbi:Aldo-keto reductase [Acidisarcina polymorpha]|uniref:Aldo-keto reductase n=1 Tax=Acidisarcina polymorpha TaxID=2211140 RepID=A0A2Z5G4V9_9BACT|nr:aldo/keto reductase [Acidisarcina polymorpha]AXC13566.1 Aldo-keto reductase [Acidisarcina polymorpha]
MATQTNKIGQKVAGQSGAFALGGDLSIKRLGFGAMRITGDGIWGEPKDHHEAIRVLRRTVELGINFIDTADAYGPEVSEQLIAEALYPYPKELVIATKGGLTRQGANQWAPVGRPEYLIQCVEMSLRRLKVERIDLWQLHRIDPKVPVEESLGAIRQLQQQGKIRHVGLSEVKPNEIDRARKTVEIVSVQNQFNIGDRKHDDTVNYCTEHKLGFIPWFPIAAGKLVRPGGPLEKAATKHGATISQLALAWLLHHSPVILPIPGTSTVKHLDENTAAAGVHLDEGEWKELEAAVAEASQTD